jgi:hypothetical protein
VAPAPAMLWCLAFLLDALDDQFQGQLS